MTQKIHGIIAAVVTPMTADAQSVDLDNIKPQVDRLAEAGIHGIVTTGTTGEFPSLSLEEHKNVIKAYIDAAKGRFPVIAGLGFNSTKLAIEMAQFSESAGASACMIVPPFYDPLPFKALYKFYEDVCGSISIPVMYYNLPGATGVHLTAAQFRELSKIKGFDYMKDTSGNAKELADLLTHPPADLEPFNGWDTLTFFAMAHGAKASVWGVASVVPKECVELWNTFTKEKDIEKAREQWKFLWEMSDFFESVCYPAAVKAGLEIVGHSAGPVRAPTLALEKKEHEKLAEILMKRKY
ncbi:dihydrodipicolinate synthase [Candidozyma pseudohaemuli]|uniref:Dihydrodipicolinate synthase n=1 Tax=Candidozyma pseudohaemuli TaxID=418784 RepID=A0A2P7Z0B5_9ASCO|nr:dihydrodipicolinate synthase [[Candida] pseudohaemulonii]PSK41657.1 dihydrodipicolinate synthase [[Candida] pseudohaemulonii]